MSAPPESVGKRTPARRKAQQLARYLRAEWPDCAYLKQVFREVRAELGIAVPRTSKRLPSVPSEEELRRYCEAVWKARRIGDVVLIKTLLYTGARVSELIRMRLAGVDLDRCQIRVNQGKGQKDRVLPFPNAFKETLAAHMAALLAKGATFLFESSRKKSYSDRGCAGCSSATPRRPAWPGTSPRAISATSCPPGSRSKASTTP